MWKKIWSKSSTSKSESSIIIHWNRCFFTKNRHLETKNTEVQLSPRTSTRWSMAKTTFSAATTKDETVQLPPNQPKMAWKNTPKWLKDNILKWTGKMWSSACVWCNLDSWCLLDMLPGFALWTHMTIAVFELGLVLRDDWEIRCAAETVPRSQLWVKQGWVVCITYVTV